MKTLNTFYMEDWLERNRFEALYNLGESGGKAQNVSELLLNSNLSETQATDIFLKTKLHDSPNWGREDLRDLVAKFHSGAEIENVLITTGTSEALFLLFRQIMPKKIALPLPAFQLLYEIPEALGAKIIPLPVRFIENGIPYVDYFEWKDILTKEKPDCLLLNNPHNPSGLIFDDNHIEDIINLSKSFDCYIIGDEHYRFLSSETTPLGKTIYKNDDKIFITGSFIKCFGAPGLRIGWCVGPTHILAKMQNEKNYTTHTVNPISEWIAYEVLKDFNTPLFNTIKSEWSKNKQLLNSFLMESNTVYGVSPQGGLVSALGYKNSETSSDEKIQSLLDNGIFVLPLSSMEVGKFDFQRETKYKQKNLCGINFGNGFRIGLGINTKDFEIALKKIESILH